MFVGYGWLEGHWIDVTHACSSVARKLVFFCRTLPRSRRRFQHLLQWEFCRYYSQIQLDPASDDRFTEIHFALIRVSVQGPIFLFFFGGSASLRSPRSGEHPLPVSKCRACSVLTIPWCKALSHQMPSFFGAPKDVDGDRPSLQRLICPVNKSERRKEQTHVFKAFVSQLQKRF